MSDKGKMNFTDNEFADFAWGKMEQVLDKEIPLGEKKKRIVAWWYWLAAGVLLVFSLGLLISQPQKNDNLAAKPLSTPSSFTNDKHKNIAQVNGKTNNNSAQKCNALDDITTNSLAQTHTPKPLLPTEVQPNFSIKNTKHKETNNKGKKQTQIPDNQLIKTKSKLTNYIKNIPLVVKESKAVSTSVSVLTLNRIIPQIKQKTRLPEYSAPLVLKPIDKKHIPSTLSTRLFIKGQTSTFTSLNGYEAGILLTKNIEKSRWSVNAGLSFLSEIVQLKIDSQLFTTTSDTSSDTTLGMNFSTTENVLFDIEAITKASSILLGATTGIDNVHLELQYISLPLQVNYKINSRLDATLGVSPAFLLTNHIIENSSYLKGTNVDDAAESLNTTGGKYTNHTIPLKNNTLVLTSKIHSPVKVKRFKLPVHVGLQYKLTKHLGLTFDASSNLLDLTDKEFIEVDYGHFKVGAYYKF